MRALAIGAASHYRVAPQFAAIKPERRHIALFAVAFAIIAQAACYAGTKYIIVPMPGASTPAIGVYTLESGCQSAGSTTGSITVDPKHGTAVPTAASFTNPSCPGSSFPGVEVYYTWTDTSGMPGSGSDAFHAHFDTSLGPADFDVFVSEGGSQKGNGTPPPPPPQHLKDCISCTLLSDFNQPVQPLDIPPNDASSTITSGGQGYAGAPINIATGNVFYGATDYTTAGANPLYFTRYYNSLATFTGFAIGTGFNWRNNYDRYLDLLNPSVIAAERPDGQVLDFFYNGSAWVSSSDTDYTLTQSGHNWTLTCPDDSVESYTQVFLQALETNEAHLTSIKARNGYTQTLSYNGEYRLQSVTDSYNRSLTFTYAGGLISEMTTPENNTFAYTYNANKTLTSVSSPLDQNGATYSYLYENGSLPMALTGVKDRYGDRLYSWSYDSQGRGLTSSRGGSGVNASLVTLAYGTNSTTVTNALGVADAYSFTLLQGVNKIAQISRAATATTAAATRTFTYDTNGYLASQTDWNGNVTNFTNNAHGLPTALSEAVGSSAARTTRLTYNATWTRLPAVITTPGLTLNYTYDQYGEPLTRKLTDTTTTTAPYSTNGQTRTWTYTYANSLLASAKSPDGNTTSYAYTGATLTKITNPLGQTTSVTSSTEGGYPKTIVDPNGVTTTISYDGEMRPTSSALSTSGGVLTTAFDWRFSDYLASITLPDNSALTYPADTALRRIGQVDSLGNNAQLTLDALGDPTAANVFDPASKLTLKHSATFDGLGRLLTDIGGAGQTSTYTYDKNGNALTYKDGLNHATMRVFDALNRVSSSTDANGGVVALTYDAYDRPLSVKDQNGNVTSYVYDGFGDVVQQTSPDSGKTVYRYDADANLTQKVDAGNIVTNRTYDALDRPLTTTYPADPVENVASTYDESGHGFGIGRLTSMTDRMGNLSRTYDERGNLLVERRGRGSVTYPTAYTYDAASRIASITYPSGNTVTYGRDAAGQVTRVAATSGTVASGVTHLPFGPVNAFTYGNGITDTRTFDLDYRMTGLVDAAGSAAYQSLGYAYDLANNVSSITDVARPYLTQSFGYDVLNRLISASQPNYGSFAWTYDKLGNRLTESRGAASLLTGYTYASGSNRLAGISVGGAPSQPLSYTPTGNLAGAGNGTGTQIAAALYNNDNRLQAVSGFGQYLQENGYDGFGQRLAKIIPGATPTGTLFQYGQDGSLLEEAELTGTAKADYIYLDGMPIGDLAPATSSLYYLHTDHLGTPQGATDSSGTPVWEAAYYPFGGASYLAGVITQNLRLSGMYYDVETQAYHNGFRDYAPTFGRYVETDPIGLDGGLNTYLYARANPSKFTDPSGLLAITNPLTVPAFCTEFPEICVGGAVYICYRAGKAIYQHFNESAPPGSGSGSSSSGSGSGSSSGSGSGSSGSSSDSGSGSSSGSGDQRPPFPGLPPGTSVPNIPGGTGGDETSGPSGLPITPGPKGGDGGNILPPGKNPGIPTVR